LRPAEAALQVLELARSEDSQLAVASEQHRAQLRSDAREWKAAIGQAWDNETHAAIRHVLLVLGNNPGRAEQVMRRPDVQHVIQDAASRLRDRLQKTTGSAWAAGVMTGQQHGIEASILLGLQPGDGEPDESQLDVLRADASRIASDLQAQLLAAITSDAPEDDLEKARRRTKLRAKLVTEAATKQGARQAKVAVLRSTNTLKMWAADFAHNPCSTCIALHGTTAEWDAEFPHDVTSHHLGTHGPLLGPPRHPNCGCDLIPVRRDSGAPVAADAASLQQAARQDAAPPTRTSAGTIRRVPARTLPSVTRWLLRRVMGDE
jgi:hypothetical protein